MRLSCSGSGIGTSLLTVSDTEWLYSSFLVFLGLCIPANNTIFIVGISSSLANKEPHLTLEVCTGLLHLQVFVPDQFENVFLLLVSARMYNWFQEIKSRIEAFMSRIHGALVGKFVSVSRTPSTRLINSNGRRNISLLLNCDHANKTKILLPMTKIIRK